MSEIYLWERLAACKGMPVGLFFDHEETQSPPPPEAVAACQGCPVRESCLEEAVRFEPFGYRGGKSAGQRRAIRKRRGIKAIPIHDYLVFDPRQQGLLADVRAPEIWERQAVPLF